MCGVENLFAVIVSDRHFRRWYQKETAFVFQLEKVLFELRKLTGAKQRVAIDDGGRQSFRIAILSRVQVEHEIDQRTFQSRAGAVEDCEPRPGNFSRALQVENAQRRPQIDVVLRLKSEFRLC